MNHEQEKHESEKTADEPATNPNEATTVEGEFKLTVRKLELPVRPRGVLAE